MLKVFNFIGSMMQFLSAQEVFQTLLPIGMILGVGIGYLGSHITTRKHLKV